MLPVPKTGTQSLPPREAWIEIKITFAELYLRWSRFPRGKRGLKLKGFIKRKESYEVASPAGSVD